MSDHLLKEAPGKSSKDERADIMRRGWKDYRACKAAGGPAFDELVRRGVAAADASRAGGTSFGTQPSRSSADEREAVQAALRAVEGLSGSTAAPVAAAAAPPGESASTDLVPVDTSPGASGLRQRRRRDPHRLGMS